MIRYKVCTKMWDGEPCMGDIEYDGPNGSRCDTCDEVFFDDVSGEDHLEWTVVWDLATNTIDAVYRSDVNQDHQRILAMADHPDTIQDYAQHLAHNQHPEFARN